MVSFSALPATFLALLLASPAFSSQTTPNDPFQVLAMHAPKQVDPPLCRLKPLQVLETVDDDVLLSFEDWKAKQFAMQEQARAKANKKDAANRSAHAHPSAGIASVAGGDGTEPSPIMPDALSQADAGLIPPSQDIPESHSNEKLSPHFRVPLIDRINYASLDCSARVHTSHRSAKSPSSILSSKKDRYMLSPCASSKDEKQYVVVELCDDIRIDTVQLANFEFFSGVFKDFTVSVAKTDTTDAAEWTSAGTYRAKNTRGVQSFHPPTSLSDFYRYIRIDFHSHYGNEYYCPVSLIRVYGLTHLEHWKWDIWEAESRAKLDQLNDMAIPVIVQEQSQPLVATASTESVGSNTESMPSATTDLTGIHDDPASSPKPVVAGGQSVESGQTQESMIHQNTQAGVPTSLEEPENPSTLVSPSPSDATFDAVSPQISAIPAPVQTEYDNRNNLSTTVKSMTNDTTKTVDAVLSEKTQATPAPPETSTHENSPVEMSESHPQVDTPTTQTAATGTVSAVPNNHNTSIRSSSTSSIATAVHSPTLSIPLPVPPPASTGGESIYRTIMNRLTALEANHTLYARYVEEQTAGVRDVLRRLGEDVGRVEAIGKAQAQMYQRTLLEWERQKNRLDMQYGELLSRVDYLTDEIVLEKRLGIAQLCLLLASLVFMGLTRGSRGETLHAASSVNLQKSMTEWGRRNLNLSADWVDRFRKRSRSATTPRNLSPLRSMPDDDNAKVNFPSPDLPLRTTPLKPSKHLNIHISAGLERASQGFGMSSPRTPIAPVRTPIAPVRTPIAPVRTSVKRQYSSNHRMSTPAGVRPRLQSAGSIPSEFAFGSGGSMPRSARKWARSAHLHEVRADGVGMVPRTGGKGKRGDGGGKSASRVTKENDSDHSDVFGTPSSGGGGGVSSPYLVAHLEGIRTSPLMGKSNIGEVAEGEDMYVGAYRGKLAGGMEESGDGDVWVDTDVDGSEAEVDVPDDGKRMTFTSRSVS